MDNLVPREQRAVDEVLDLHLLPESDRDKVMGYARDSVRALLFAALLGIIDQPDPRTAAEQGIVDVYAELVRQKRLTAAEFALSEYNRWEDVVCNDNGFGYRPPLGFSYPNQSTACQGITSVFGGPKPPTSAEFIAYGTAHAYNQINTDPQTAAVAANTAQGLALLGVVATAGLLGTATFAFLAYTALGAVITKAIAPVIGSIVLIKTTATAAQVGAALTATAASVASVVAVVILAVVVGVLQGISVVEAEAIPGELQARVEAARVAPDLRESIQMPEGQQELYAVFIESTMPDYPATQPPPAPVASDQRFRVKDELEQDLGVFTSIAFQSPSLPGTDWEARLSGGWFVPQYVNADATVPEGLSLAIAYFDWDGNRRLAWRRADQFVITNPDATSPDEAGEIVDEIRFKDWDGNKLVASIVAADETPPVITPAIAGTPGTNDWYRSDVRVTWGVEDPESDIQSSSGCGDRSITADGVSNFGCTATSEGGTASESLTIKRDATLPVIGHDRDPVPNAAGWNNADVTISFTCDDALSGIAACSGPQTVSTEGANQSVTGSATDQAGNTATSVVSGINIDKTAPRIRDSRMLAPNAAGWYNVDVTVVFVCDDALSGVATCTAPQTLSSEGENQSVTGSSTDKAGNTATTTVSGISIDKTAPLVAVTGVADGATYTFGAVPEAGCSTSDALSGVETEASIAVTGGTGNGVGYFTAACTGATDQAGNADAASASYQVAYPFSQFTGPVANPPSVNQVKAGASVPLKFSLGGDFGLDILADGSPASRPIGCDFAETAINDAESTVTAGSSGLAYDPVGGQYSYVWKTSKAWSRTCRELVFTLDDGATHRAYFRFK